MPKRWTVAVTRQIPEAGLALLREEADVRVWEDDLPPPREELVRLLNGCDGAIKGEP